jgi:predicted nuclease of restriction endonuclease-like (RecB) superfamily
LKGIEKFSKDIHSTFPKMKGFSLRNVQFLVQFARQYTNFEIVKQLVSQIPWGHNILLLQKINKGFGTQRKPSKMVGAEAFFCIG